MNEHQAGCRVVALLLLLTCCAAVGSAQEPRRSVKFTHATETMQSFLGAWLVDNNEEAAMGHFAVTERALELAPRAVWRLVQNADPSDRAQVHHLWDSLLQEEYWKVLRRIRGKEHDGASLETILAPLDPDLAKVLYPALGDYVIRTEPFTVFLAPDADAIDNFDGGYGDVAAALKPASNTILTMIADFNDRGHEGYIGPFVSFWAEEWDESNGEQWKIQALGAVPEDEMWRDGLSSPGFDSEIRRAVAPSPR